MDNVNRTLYIPLYGKAFVSRKGLILRDPKAEEIWAADGFPLKGKSRSKWLAYYMGMRAAVFDRWLETRMDAAPAASVMHLGCGMDSRVLRIGSRDQLWFDVDFPAVIAERRRYYQESGTYRMIPADIRDPRWLADIPAEGGAIVVMEGVSMYLRPEELSALLKNLAGRFGRVRVLMDCYTTFAAKASKYKNPINDVGVSLVYGLDDPHALESGTGVKFLQEHDITPAPLIAQLSGGERLLFQKLYAGSISKKMYRLYEFCTN